MCYKVDYFHVMFTRPFQGFTPAQLYPNDVICHPEFLLTIVYSKDRKREKKIQFNSNIEMIDDGKRFY